MEGKREGWRVRGKDGGRTEKRITAREGGINGKGRREGGGASIIEGVKAATSEVKIIIWSAYIDIGHMESSSAASSSCCDFLLTTASIFFLIDASMC
jgi:hypothetical protein